MSGYFKILTNFHQIFPFDNDVFDNGFLFHMIKTIYKDHLKNTKKPMWISAVLNLKLVSAIFHYF